MIMANGGILSSSFYLGNNNSIILPSVLSMSFNVAMWQCGTTTNSQHATSGRLDNVAYNIQLKPKSAIEIYFDALQLNYLNRRIQLETVTWFLRANPRQQKKKGDLRRVEKKLAMQVASW